MVVILDLGDFWIETFIVARAAIAANTVSGAQVILTKAGRFVGGSVSLDTNFAASTDDISCSMATDPANAEITYGLALTAIQVKRVNNTAAPITFGVKVVLFLRK